MKYPFAQQSADDGTWAASARLLNLYRQNVGGNVVLRSVLGSERFGKLAGVFSRAAQFTEGAIYAVQGGTAYEVAQNGVETLLGTVESAGDASIAGNNGNVTFCAGGRYYVWDMTTLTQTTGGAFSNYGSVCFFDQRTFLTEKDGARVQWSDPGDPTTLNGLNFATAEYKKSDPIVRALPVGSSLWVFKETYVEQWAQFAPSDYRAIGGSLIDFGLKGFDLVTQIPGGCFWISTDNAARLGGDIVSNDTVARSIANENPLTVGYFEDTDHKFCVITFQHRPAWIYDITTGEWCERQETVGSWTARQFVQGYGKQIAIHDDGRMSEQVRIGTDWGEPLIKRVVGVTTRMMTERTRVHEFFVDMAVGTNQIGDQLSPDEILGDDEGVLGEGGFVLGNPGVTPQEEQIELRTSKDKGRTWSDPKPRGLGLIGEYDRQVNWRRLGLFTDFTAELTYAGSTDITIGATADIRSG